MSAAVCSTLQCRGRGARGVGTRSRVGLILAILVLSAVASIRVTDDSGAAAASSRVSNSVHGTTDGSAFLVFRRSAAPGATIAGVKSQRPRILRITQ